MKAMQHVMIGFFVWCLGVALGVEAEGPVAKQKSAAAPDAAALLRTMRDETEAGTVRDKAKKWATRSNAARAYAKLPDFRSKEVLPLLGSDNYETRIVGVLALEGGGKESVPILLDRMASDPHGSVKAFCATVLGNIGDPRAFQPLLDMASRRDTHWPARWYAVGALGKFHDSRATPVLAQIIEDILNNPSRDSLSADAAVKSLAMIGDAEAVQSLAKIAEHPRTKNSGSMAATSESARYLIAKVNNPASIEALGKLAERDSDLPVTRNAVRALGNFRSDRAAELLEEVYERHGISSRESCGVLASLGRTGVPRACKALWHIGLDRKADPGCRGAAAHALSGFDDQVFVPFVSAEWKGIQPEPDEETLGFLAGALVGHSDQRLIPLWKNVFAWVAPTVRKQHGWNGEGWGSEAAPTRGFRIMSCFLLGIQQIGKPSLEYVRTLRDQEQEPRLKQLLDRTIKQVEAGSSTKLHFSRLDFQEPRFKHPQHQPLRHGTGGGCGIAGPLEDHDQRVTGPIGGNIAGEPGMVGLALANLGRARLAGNGNLRQIQRTMGRAFLVCHRSQQPGAKGGKCRVAEPRQ